MKILVIDDDTLSLAVLKKGLENSGHTVSCAVNGFEALNELDNRNFDFVLCDVFMPELSGFIVANSVRQFNQKIPFLFMSADKNIGHVIMDQYNFEFEFITKPFTIPELISKMEEVCRKTNPATWN